MVLCVSPFVTVSAVQLSSRADVMVVVMLWGLMAQSPNVEGESVRLSYGPKRL
jgi:hypothetical protein